MSETISKNGLRAFLCRPANAARLNQSKPVALELVLALLAKGGSSDLSEMKWAVALQRSPNAIAAGLAWLESEGALTVDRRSSGGLKLSSVRTVNLAGCLALFGRVLGKVAVSVASVGRRARVLAIMRSFRPRPSSRVHTPVAGAERKEPHVLVVSCPVQAAEMRLADWQQGREFLEPATVARLAGLVAENMGMNAAEYLRALKKAA